MFLYAATGIFFMALKKLMVLLVVGILFFHCVFDLVNNEPGLLIYPLSGFFDMVHHYPPVGEKILQRLPEMFSITDFTGHYLLFEITGLILIVLMSWLTGRRAMNREKIRDTDLK